MGSGIALRHLRANETCYGTYMLTFTWCSESIPSFQRPKISSLVCFNTVPNLLPIPFLICNLKSVADYPYLCSARVHGTCSRSALRRNAYRLQMARQSCPRHGPRLQRYIRIRGSPRVHVPLNILR